jgi:16S rRNA (cytosine967-C5)-methyltransferase
MVAIARKVAFQVLQKTEHGGYASDLLLVDCEGLDSRDAGLASEIVFGCLRRQAQLDWLIAQGSKRDPGKLDVAVRVALRMGLYQLRHLDRVPPHAILNDSVDLVKLARKASASGFVNAILRRAPRGSVDWPNRSVALSMPEWLLARWDKQFGAPQSTRIAEAFLQLPETFVRNPPMGRPDLALEPTEVEGAFRVAAGDITGLRVQDIGSQSIVPLLDLHPGHSFLDVCAAPGNKTAQALETGIRAIACDIHVRRLDTVQGCSRVALDATRGLPFKATFDRILVDAPCSGTGTLGRNPEIRWRLQPSDIEELHEKQARILENALGCLRKDGRLVYSTCSLERRENEEVVDRVAGGIGYRIADQRYRIPGADSGDGFFASVLEPKVY